MQQQLNRWIGLACLLGLTGCASQFKPPFITPGHPPLLDQPGGVALVTDGCVQRRVMLGANYFVLSVSDAAARTLFADARNYLARRGVSSASDTVSSVCGVLQDAENVEKSQAESLDQAITRSRQPLRMSPSLQRLADDPYRLAALLAELQRFAQQRPAAWIAAQATDGQEAKDAVVTEASRDLLVRLAQRAGSSSLLFIGLSGNSESGGKQFAQMALLVGVGVAAGLAAGPVSASGALTASQTAAINATTAAGASFMSNDGWLLVAALVDAASGKVVWTNRIRGINDPVEPAAFESAGVAEGLLRPLLNRPASQWSLPGRAPALAVSGN